MAKDRKDEEDYINSPEAAEHLVKARELLDEAKKNIQWHGIQPGVYMIALIEELAAVAVTQERPGRNPDDGLKVIGDMLKEYVNQMRSIVREIENEEATENLSKLDLGEITRTAIEDSERRMRVTITRTSRVPQDSITEQIDAAIKKGATRP